MLSLTSLGGAGTVTGSKHLITHGNTRIGKGYYGCIVYAVANESKFLTLIFELLNFFYFAFGQ